ncbi:uncharacterized protein C8Q71DRAFT_856503 [Rhodofomes roseus]|uniref:DUF6532 domain-containing protein n=1 Tax=Rhodofomes roseus TaxID=34475 RepID=A0ABQ8KKF9_9APHY|nr:uncharacterized protein C8Q71DRAFT_856503 [Rhodofomes roseus]KAH9838566.1 hypothetical protein C8Q71DRAFT_856503 [Rhodofomes roseus]
MSSVRNVTRSRIGQQSRVDLVDTEGRNQPDDTQIDEADDEQCTSQRPTRLASQAAPKAWASMVPKKRAGSTNGGKATQPQPRKKVEKVGNTDEIQSRVKVQEKRKRADSASVKSAKDLASEKTAAPRLKSTNSEIERRPQQKKAKVGNLRPANFNENAPSNKRPPRAAVINDASDSDSPSPPPPPPRPRTSRSSQATRSQLQPSAAATRGIEDGLDDDGEVVDHDEAEYEQEGELEGDEEAESREQCVDFEAERVTITGSSNSRSTTAREAPDSADDVPSPRPPRFRSKSSRSSSVVSYYNSEPPATDDDFLMHGADVDEDEAQAAHSDYDRVYDEPVAYSSDPAIGGDADDLDEDEIPEVVSRGQRQVRKRYRAVKLHDISDPKLHVQLTQKQQDKLKSEMPEIRRATQGTAKTKKTKKQAQTHHSGSASVSSKMHDNIKWLPRSNITVIKLPKSTKMGKKAQDGEVQQVMSHAYTLGEQMMVFGRAEDRELDITIDALNTMVTPMDKIGLDRIAYDALVQSADTLGYGGEGDIAHRLEDGSFEDYTRPLMTDVARRVSMARTGIRKAIAFVVEHEFKLTIKSGNVPAVPDKMELLKEMNYIYPWTPTGGFDGRAPYESEMIKSVIRSGFFTNAVYLGIGLQSVVLCPSSLASKPSEYEVPRELVSLAMTAVESVIHEHSLRLGKALEFGAASAPAYREHMVRLADFRQQKPKRYHRVMHDIFKAVTTGHALHSGTHGGSTSMNWDNIPDDDSE